jgi:hypothetical protein
VTAMMVAMLVLVMMVLVTLARHPYVNTSAQ